MADEPIEDPGPTRVIGSARAVDVTELATDEVESLPAPALPSMIGAKLGPQLTIRDVLGQGAMGIVYRAHQASMDRDVAVKVLTRAGASDADTVRRFLQEGKVASKLHHPHVVTVFDFGQTEDQQLYLVMELLEGKTLADELDACDFMPPERAVELVVQVCDALDHAHAQGLVHRDLKPSNVFLLRDNGRGKDFVKVLDFGVARVLGGDEAQRMTRTGHVCGTPAYMSPEQALGDPLDARSDVYALGILAFELLSGVVPFAHDSLMRVMHAHIKEPVPRMADVSDVSVPPNLEAVVRRALAKARGERPASARAFAEELMAAMRGEPAGNASIRRLPPTRVARAFNPALVAAPSAILGAPTRDDSVVPVRAKTLRNAGILSFVVMLVLVIWHIGGTSVPLAVASVSVPAPRPRIAAQLAQTEPAFTFAPAPAPARDFPAPRITSLGAPPAVVVAQKPSKPSEPKPKKKPTVTTGDGAIE